MHSEKFNCALAFLLEFNSFSITLYFMVQLIKKGGLRERANRSRRYQGSENTETTLEPNRYVQRVIQHSETTVTEVLDNLEQNPLQKEKAPE